MAQRRRGGRGSGGDARGKQPPIPLPGIGVPGRENHARGLPMQFSPQAFSGVRVSSTHWHARLGHPAAPIVRHVLHRHKLPVVSNKTAETIFDAYQQGKRHQLPFSEYSRVVKHPLELVFSDVWGHAQTSVSG